MIAKEKGTFLDTALELLSCAISAEDDHEYTEAYAQYMAAIDYLMAAQQSETNEKSRTFLKTKTDEYLNRAETIRSRVDVEKRTQADVGGFNEGHTTAQSVVLDEAFKCAKRAIDADASQNYAEAYEQYVKSTDYFMFAQRYEVNEQSRTLIRSEVAEYISRAEDIKKHLNALKEPMTTAHANLGGGTPCPPEAVFLRTAIEITQRAIHQDARKNYQSAYELYNGALDYFMLAQKYEKNEQSRRAILVNMEEYLARAEILKHVH